MCMAPKMIGNERTGDFIFMTWQEFEQQFSIQLNEQQKSAVQSVDGPVLLLAVPGSGKTTLLESTIKRLGGRDFHKIAVIEGDQHTDNDAGRIRNLGIPAIQINTHNGCHLDARMVSSAFDELAVKDTLLFIENVGNLVCPAMFDLGENLRVILLSVTEGDDKPLKYPYMFAGADICIINKIDLLPYVDSDVARLKDNALKINPQLSFFEISATRGMGMDEWCEYLLACFERKEEK